MKKIFIATALIFSTIISSNANISLKKGDKKDVSSADYKGDKKDVSSADYKGDKKDVSSADAKGDKKDVSSAD